MMMFSPDLYKQLLESTLSHESAGRLALVQLFPPSWGEDVCFQRKLSLLGVARLRLQAERNQTVSAGDEILYRFPYPSARGTFIIAGREMSPSLRGVIKRREDDNEDSNNYSASDLARFHFYPAPLLQLRRTLRRLFSNDATTLPSAIELEGALNLLHYPFLTVLEQTNALIELAERRKVSLPQGKLARFLHESHRHKLCPLETPESLEIGLQLFLARDARFEPAEQGWQINNDRLDSYFGLSATLVPFIQHNDSARAMMGGKNLKQALPLVEPELPFIKTGLEKYIAQESGRIITARATGHVATIEPERIVLVTACGDESYALSPLRHASSNTPLRHQPRVRVEEQVKVGQLLADWPGTHNGELALGTNVLVAYLPFFGYNIEDGIVVSESLAARFTSHHLYEFTLKLRDGEEFETTTELIAQAIGRPVEPGDVLARKRNRTGEPDELCYDKRFPGTIVKAEAQPQYVIFWVATERCLEVGDKLTGRHGNKGVVTRIVPDEYMPYFETRGRRYQIEILLNPMGVVSRMNLGQLLETHYGWLVHTGLLGDVEVGKPFHELDIEDLRTRLVEACLPDGKAEVFLPEGILTRSLGRVVVGYQYFSRLNHLARDKFHVRASGHNYSVVTEQPVGGKRLGGGQRLGEMEVWALLAHGAFNLLEEMLTIKSDDRAGRVSLVGALEMPGEELPHRIARSFPETLNALRQYLRGIGCELQFLKANEQPAQRLDELDHVVLRLASTDEMIEWTHGRLSIEHLTECLVEQRKPLFEYLRSRCSHQLQGALDAAFKARFHTDQITQAVNHALLCQLVENELHSLTPQAALYDEKIFVQAKVSIKEPLRRLISAHPQGVELEQINSRLLDEVYRAKSRLVNNLGDLTDEETFGRTRDTQRAWMGYIKLAAPIPHPLLAPPEIAHLFKSENQQSKKRGLQEAVASFKAWGVAVVQFSKEQPEAMIEVVPVLPLAYRPEELYGAHPLTVLYRQVLMANRSVQQFRDGQAKKTGELVAASAEAESCRRQYRLFKAIRNLWLAGSNDQPSILNHLEGKFGLLRRHLLGKRQDFSGRAVIVPDPDLKIDECGLPWEMALGWLESSVRHELQRESVGRDATGVINQARRGVATAQSQVKTAIERVLQQHDLLCLLNRQPSLHRYNLLAFKPKLRDDFVIGLPPLLCGGFNADFDGDTMAVYLPLTRAAQLDARRLLPTHHLFKVANGDLLLSLGQDYALGASLLMAGESGRQQLSAILNQPLASPLKPGALTRHVAAMIHQSESIAEIVNSLAELQKITFCAAATGAASFSFFDVAQLALSTEEASRLTAKLQLRPLNPDEERTARELNAAIENDVWRKAELYPDNPFARYLLSGARGGPEQLRQMAGMIGYVFNGEAHPLGPLAGNFVKGLTPDDYWNLCHSTRRTMIDKKLSVGRAGALTRDIVEGAYEWRIVTDDCGAADGVIIQSLPDQTTLDITGRVRLPNNTVIADRIDASWLPLSIRSPLTCIANGGICRRCYGHDRSTGTWPEVGLLVGVLAAQSIGERGTQLSMQTFHTGGLAMNIDDVEKLFGRGQLQIDEEECPHVISDASALFQALIVERLTRIYGKAIAPVHFEVLLRAMWQPGTLTGCQSLARDLKRRGLLAAIAYRDTARALREAIREGQRTDSLSSPKSWIMTGRIVRKSDKL
jgi:DNA-directed RNA polymerase beta' subunit